MLQIAKRTGCRRGFTLVEMLVVIAIMAILLSLTGVAVFRIIGVQQSPNTKSELSRWRASSQVGWRLGGQIRQGADPYSGVPYTVYYNTVLPMAGGDRERARVIWTKLRLKQTFPITFAEALNPAPMPALTRTRPP